MTNAQRIRRVLKRTALLSATEVANRLKESPATISSTMYRMWLHHQLTRLPDSGPRGGYAYDIWS